MTDIPEPSIMDDCALLLAMHAAEMARQREDDGAEVAFWRACCERAAARRETA